MAINSPREGWASIACLPHPRIASTCPPPAGFPRQPRPAQPLQCTARPGPATAHSHFSSLTLSMGTHSIFSQYKHSRGAWRRGRGEQGVSWSDEVEAGVVKALGSTPTLLTLYFVYSTSHSSLFQIPLSFQQAYKPKILQKLKNGSDLCSGRYIVATTNFGIYTNAKESTHEITCTLRLKMISEQG